MKAIQLSMDEDLLRRLDALPEAKRLGRSALIRRITEAYLVHREQLEIRDAYRRGLWRDARARRRIRCRSGGVGMARRMTRGDVYQHRSAKPDKRRPVVVLSRPEAIEVLHEVMVAPITSTVRNIPSEVQLGTERGMKVPCAVNLDHVQTVRQTDLRGYVTTLDATVMRSVCRALAIATGCS